MPEPLGTWLALAALGAFHGLNPGMGWLFALALGMQQRSERATLRALLPITLGHAASVGLVALLLFLAGALVSLDALRVATAAVLLLFGAYRLLRWYRHPRWVGNRVSGRELFAWSFLMASAHGAGLMVAPLLLRGSASHGHGGHLGGAGIVAGVGVHTLAMLLTVAAVAWVVYRRLGVAVLRRGWVNFDLLWAVALLAVGAVALWRAV